jgi:hypothetical protein
MAMQKNLG